MEKNMLIEKERCFEKVGVSTSVNCIQQATGMVAIPAVSSKNRDRKEPCSPHRRNIPRQLMATETFGYTFLEKQLGGPWISLESPYLTLGLIHALPLGFH